MPTLVIQLPPRVRGATADVGGELPYVLTPDGINITGQGRALPSALPRADGAVVVLDEQDVSWHRVTLPRANAARMRAALVGVLEEQLLDDADGVHLALAPMASAGQSTWVAATDRAWLKAQLSALDKAGIAVERVVPMAWPEDTPLGHFGAPLGDDAGAPMRLTWSDANGVTTLALHGELARRMLPQWGAQPARWSAHPAVAAPAERWLGAPVAVLGDEQRLLQAMRSLWTLLQFDLAPKHRGTVALRDAMRRWKSASWRPVRWGLAALVALQVVGLNLWAWHQERQIVAKRDAAIALLKSSFPHVRAIVDPAAQMQRETDLLRVAAGQSGESDLETLLAIAASAWPDGQPPLATLKFENGRLAFSTAGWTESQLAQFRSQLGAAGWTVSNDGGATTISRAAAPPGRAT
ncbi:MAG TPA: type II secretion system protein GspL [Burkholderiaceae bacterium]|nr:type II secretion system protein GspL [Burkholderiaceae bacterium]